jgi:FG-GAP-like repeat
MLKRVSVFTAVALCALPAGATNTFIETSKAWGSVVADFNNDGQDDIFVTGHDENDRIWHRTLSGYVPSAQVLRFVDRHDCDAADINLDGRIDMFCAVGAEKGTGSAPNELWLQQTNGTFFADLASGAEDIYGRARRPLFLDANNDGLPDIYLTNLATIRPDGQPNINRLFINNGASKFVETVTTATGALGSSCVAKGDVNGDGWDDLVVCAEKGDSHIFINDKNGNFIDIFAAGQFGPAVWADAKLSDVNSDGRDDLIFITKKNVINIRLNSGGSPFFASPSFQDTLPGIPSSITIGTFDNDARKDIYVVLRDSSCPTTLKDTTPDVLYRGRAGGAWKKSVLDQKFSGCGYLADTVDGSKVLLMQGGETSTWRGPTYLIDLRQ